MHACISVACVPTYLHACLLPVCISTFVPVCLHACLYVCMTVYVYVYGIYVGIHACMLVATAAAHMPDMRSVLAVIVRLLYYFLYSINNSPINDAITTKANVEGFKILTILPLFR